MRGTHGSPRTSALMKSCADCEERKPLREFRQRATRPIGQLDPYCNPCRRARWRDWYQRNIEQARRKDLDRQFRRKYGLEPEEREVLLAVGCAICGDKASDIDHDHLNGNVRAALCAACNQGLGKFGDDPERLRAAAHYIERHS